MAFQFRQSSFGPLQFGQLQFGQFSVRTLPLFIAPLILVALLWTPAQAALPAQAGANPQTVLSESSIIREWRIDSGFIYWHESCRTFLDQTEAFLKRRPVNGTAVTTQLDIDDAEDCETLLGLGADSSGVYFYNRAAGTIEAIYSNDPTAAPTVLATVGDHTAVGFGDAISAMFPHGDHVYWIEVDARGEFVDNLFDIRRVAKSGGTPETLLTYEGFFAGHSMGFSLGFLYWTDSDGLNRIRLSDCPGGSCTKDNVHDQRLRQGRMVVTDAQDIIWFDDNPTADQFPRIYRTRCPLGASCTTQIRYTAAETSTRIDDVAANNTHIFWSENILFVGQHVRRLPMSGGSPETLLEEDDVANATLLDLDAEGLYFYLDGRQEIARIALDAAAIQREISFGGWEVTQAIQNLQNTVPLLAGRDTFVRVFPQLDDGTPAAAVSAVLHGERDGTPLPGSPLLPVNGPIAVNAGNALANRDDVDGGWLFQLPPEWTRSAEEAQAAIPLENSALTLRAQIDPANATSDTTPGNNSAEGNFNFVAKAPTCINLRSVRTIQRYQPPWDISVATVVELSESVHPTVDFLTFPEYNQLEEIEWCWKGIVYGPFCSGPYELNDDDSGLLTKMGVLDFFHDNPSICFATGARTLYAGIVSTETPWDWAGLARVGKDQSLSKVPRYGTWSWPLTRASGLGMTFVHELGHNYNRRHIDCGNPKRPDTNYPYATDTLDDGALDAPATHYGFDPRLLEPIAPDTHRDYMSYCGPRWISDYTWKAIVNNTRDAGPLLPFGSSADTTVANQGAANQANAYVLASGIITPDLDTGELSSIWTYPTAEASDSLIQKWESEVVPPWTDEPYHVRLVDAEGEPLTDRAVVLFEVEEQNDPESFPFNVIFPAPAGDVAAVQLLAAEAVLDTYATGTTTPTVNIVAPTGGETVDATFNLQWTADDADDPPWLLYTVQYSPDMGETWFSLLANHPGLGQGELESLEVDLRGEPGSAGQNALLRVLASDGYYTGIATSEPFSVTNRIPDVLITAPEAGQWFTAGEAVPLHGTAFDPEDGVLPNDAYLWSVGTQTFNRPEAVAVGLAPGVYTATLQATDSISQTGSAQVNFEVAPLQVELGSDLVLDGACSDLAYGAPSLPLVPANGFDPGTVTLARTADHLWVCFSGMSVTAGSLGVQIDADNSQDTTRQSGDLSFFVQDDGTLTYLNGAETAPVPGGVVANVRSNDAGWSAEFRLEAQVFGGWGRRVAASFSHNHNGTAAAWPYRTNRDDPSTWAQTNLGAGELPTLRALSRISIPVGSTLGISLTGTAFDADTTVLWNGTAYTPTLVDAATLELSATVGLFDQAGLQLVQVAQRQTPELASAPQTVLVYYPAATVSDLSPASTPVESSSFELTVDGSGFVEGATVLWNGEERTTQYVSDTRLTAQISAEDVAAARPVPVAVANPDPNGGISPAATFTILPPEDTGAEADLYVPTLQSD